jgi:hypothetical protein
VEMERREVDTGGDEETVSAEIKRRGRQDGQ